MCSRYQLVGTPGAAFSRKPSGLTLPFLLSEWPLVLTQALQGGLAVLVLCVCVCVWKRQTDRPTETASLILQAIVNAFS